MPGWSDNSHPPRISYKPTGMRLNFSTLKFLTRGSMEDSRPWPCSPDLKRGRGGRRSRELPGRAQRSFDMLALRPLTSSITSIISAEDTVTAAGSQPQPSECSKVPSISQVPGIGGQRWSGVGSGDWEGRKSTPSKTFLWHLEGRPQGGRRLCVLKRG